MGAGLQLAVWTVVALAPAHYVVYRVHGMTTDDAQRRWGQRVLVFSRRFG